MTVKISNKKLYEVYKVNKGMSSSSLAKKVWYFLGDVVRFNVFADADSIKKVVNAIFEGDDVELEERRYALRYDACDDYGFVFAIGSDGLIIIEKFSKSNKHWTDAPKYTRFEWDIAATKSPYVNLEIANEVEDDSN